MFQEITNHTIYSKNNPLFAKKQIANSYLCLETIKLCTRSAFERNQINKAQYLELNSFINSIGTFVFKYHLKINKKKHLLKSFLLILMFFLPNIPAYSKERWELIFQPRQRTVTYINSYKDTIYTGTGNGIFISNDNGKTWEDFGTNQLQRDYSGNSLIKWIEIVDEKIYIATSFGAYYSNLNKPDWQKIPLETKTEDTTINSIAVKDKELFICSNDGFWICSLNNSFCKRANNGVTSNPVTGNHEALFSLITDNNSYLSTSNGLYEYKNNDWEDISNGIQRLPNGQLDIKHLLIDNENNLWAASGSGIYKKDLNSTSWIKRSKGILPDQEGFEDCSYLAKTENDLLCACTSGVYKFNSEDNTWKQLSLGLKTKDGSKKVYCINKYKNMLLAATDEGLYGLTFLLEDTSAKVVLKGKIESDFANLNELEPSIVETQEQALKFAAIPTNNDYKRYRIEARLRNIFPKVGFDINSTGNNTNYLQLKNGISADTKSDNQFDFNKTQQLQNDNRNFQQFSILWNTNQLIYDDEITGILNHARLTANIRENLLDDVTKIYFERRKLQLTNLATPKPNSIDKLQEEIEIAELTGQLDSRTGGWFSREIEKRKRRIVNEYE